MANLQTTHTGAVARRDGQHPRGPQRVGPSPDRPPMPAVDDEPPPYDVDEEIGRLVRARVQADLSARRRRYAKTVLHAEEPAARGCDCRQPRQPGVLRPDPASAARVVTTCPVCRGSL
ncbi:hypothetical protein [Jiangella asiatica]|uniref:Uncharacterized protein n=1 Tax=Jiangella asiatica TaxID=2530372 RepID=A0A4R5CCL5_9ACTN|nr:hypothetical protein [Jiangella asiatica]TDD97741.1 hypothetical protein E1269_29465 [Jiangella asiatica]